MGTFIQRAITDAFVREIQESEDKIKLMEKYYNEYFDESEPNTSPTEREEDNSEITAID